MALDSMPPATLQATATKKTEANTLMLEVSLKNTSKVPAIMAHLQLRNSISNERVLPVFYNDNYVSLLPGESTTISVESSMQAFKGQQPMIVVDGLNILINETTINGVLIKLNDNAQVNKWPVTGLPFSPFNMGKR